MEKSIVSISLITGNGNLMTEYRKNNKIFVEGRKNSQYKIKISNNTSNRILAVPTVDGLSVITGKPGSYKSNGYILNGFQSMIVDGWRISDNNVREFVFGSKNQSYAGKTGNNKQNCGVIGAAFFNEKYVSSYEFKPFIGGYGSPTFDSFEENCTGNPVPKTFTTSSVRDSGYKSVASTARGMTLKATSLGTQMGEEAYSPVTHVDFNRTANPFQILTMYYHTRNELKKMGIISTKTKHYNTPEAFPNRYCTEV